MTRDEAKKLPIGLYRIFWKDGGWSLAAVGMNSVGDRWLAPVNWLEGNSLNSWPRVSSAVQLHKGKTNVG